MARLKIDLPVAVFTNTIYQGIGKLVVTIFGIITTIVLTRYLGVISFGQLNLIFSYLTIAATIAYFGLSTILARELSKGKATDLFINNIFTLRIITSIVVLLLFIIISLFSPYPPNIIWGIIIYSLGNLFLLAYNIYFAIFQAELRLEKHMVAEMVGGFITLLSVLIFVYLHFPFLFMVGAQVFGQIATFFVGKSLSVRTITLTSNFSYFLPILKIALPFFLINVLSIIYWKVDIIILSFLKSPVILPDVGIYSLAFRIFEVMVIFGSFFAQALFPVIVKRQEGKILGRILREATIISLIAGLLTIFAMFFLARYIILLIGGVEFLPAVLPLQILTFAFAVILIINIFYYQIIAFNLQFFVVPIAALALLFNVVANLVFIPQFSYIASATINTLTQVVILIGYIFVLLRFKKS